SDTDITLRLDGSEEATMGMSGTPANTRKWVTLGSRSTGMNFSGYILAVLVYDRALTPTEANTIRQYLIDTYAVPVPYPAVTLQTDLAGYWKLDEAEGFSRNDSSVNAWDLGEWSFQEATGGSYRPIYQISGIHNYAADFGDESGGEGLVSFAPNSLLAGDFTFSCWFNYNTTSGFDGQGLISVGGTAQIGIRAYDGALNFVIYTNNQAGYSGAQTPDYSVSEYTWTHAVFVKDGNSLRIYVNGYEQAYADLTGNIVPTAAGFFGASDLILGINPWGYPLIGAMDEVGCWQRALTAGEVEQLYNYGSGLPFENF
ncbi:MAG: LamG domain-containing protein, partial [Verrucomicrobiota bacterium]